MKYWRLLMISISIILLSSIALASNYEYFIYYSGIKVLRAFNALQEKNITINNGLKINYLVNKNIDPSLETLVLLHGYAMDKDIWLQFISNLAHNYNIVIPDIPGHGNSTSPLDISYQIDDQAKRIHSFLSMLGVNRYHLLGHSMGGGIALSYAQTYPNEVITLGLMDPAVYNPNEKSPFFELLEKGKNPLIVKNAGDINTLLKITMTTTPWNMRLIQGQLEKIQLKRIALNTKIFSDLQLSKNNFINNDKLTKLLVGLSMPVILLWGDNDKIFDVADTSLFINNVSNLNYKIFKDVGHAPLLENPKKCAQTYEKYLHSLSTTAKLSTP